ncbi:hypothetical protein GCM10023196_033450 [Actinoallomurus vinaceus]|uniref:Uncharacterized protein n=1 Tax=Actinoallomurus vinaceus TaxID=1080074 RepID=A0ABP8U9Z7_9ACTN
MTWTTREALTTPRDAAGLLLVSPEADLIVPLTAEDRAAALEIATTTLRAAGVGPSDRVVVALGNDGEATGTLIAQACAEIAQAAAAPGPRGRLRLHHALEAVRATTLIATPTGAMDLLARLHLEFLLDPLDLGLRHILLTGEMPSPGAYGQLASEFEAEVGELYADPFFGLPTAYRSARDTAYTPAREGLLGVAPLGKDVLLEPPYASGSAEIVVTPAWHSTLGGTTLRTGQVVRLAEGAGIPAPEQTVGEHVLLRGRWLSIPRVAAALARIDGIAHWDLRIAREGTLDAAALHVTFNRATLVKNPMWRSRIHQALVAVTPVTIEVVVEDDVAEQARPGSVTDLRGHHLGRDRSAVVD